MPAAPRLYLDANATEPLRPAARDALLEALDVANPSSVHAEGRAARALLEAARRRIAMTLGTDPASVVFTSGATEANAMVLQAAHRQGRAVLASAIEHDSVHAALGSAPVTLVPVTPAGIVDLGALEEALRRAPAGVLVALLAAHNETGIVQPLAEAARLIRAAGATLHCDSTQAPGRIDLAPVLAEADTIALSGHKAGAAKGAGLLVAPRSSLPEALVRGGGQERGHRAGTEPLPAILALAAGLEEALRRDDAARLGRLRDALETSVAELVPSAWIVGAGQVRLPNTTCLVLPGRAAATQVIALDLAGVAVSAGSACSSGKVAASRSLAAMGLGEVAGHAIRISLPWNAPEDAASRFLAAYAGLARQPGR